MRECCLLAPRLPPKWYRGAVIIVTTGFILLNMAFFTFGSDNSADWSRTDTVVADVIGFAMIAILVMLYGTSYVRVSPSGLRVRNVLKTHAIEWNSITGAHWGFNGISPDATGIYLELVSGRNVALNGVFDLPFGKVSYAESWMEWIQARGWAQSGVHLECVDKDKMMLEPAPVGSDRRRRRVRFALLAAAFAAIDLRIGHPTMLPILALASFWWRR